VSAQKQKLEHTFSQMVKEEIATLLGKATKAEFTAFLSGFFKQSGSLRLQGGMRGIDVQTANAVVARKVFQEIKRHYPAIQVDIVVRRMVKLKKQNIYVLRISDPQNTLLVATSFFDAEGGFSFTVPTEYRQGHLFHNYMQGVFLGRGSVNNLQQTNYHLELSFLQADYGLAVKDCMAHYGINFKQIKRRGAFILYLKDSTMIGDFLAFIKASHARFAFEDVRISRDMMNSMNRLINSEVANEQKAMKASKKQVENIRIIEQYIGLQYFNEREQLVATARIQHPEISLNELSDVLFEEYRMQISKSGLNHVFRKFAAEAEKYDVKKNKSSEEE
jgi:hypothetical protein